jgi:hypothetical protein
LPTRRAPFGWREPTAATLGRSWLTLARSQWSPASDLLTATVCPPAGRAKLCELGPGVKPWLLASTDGPAQWAPNGRELLLYVRDDALWLINPAGGRPGSLVAQLSRGAWPNYYFNIDWRDQFASFSRR